MTALLSSLGESNLGLALVAWLISRHRNDDPNHNDIWGISLAGIGWTGKNEYHIINYRSGTFLTYDEKAPERSKLTGKTLGPANSRVRWNVSLCLPYILFYANARAAAHSFEEPQRQILVSIPRDNFTNFQDILSFLTRSKDCSSAKQQGVPEPPWRQDRQQHRALALG